MIHEDAIRIFLLNDTRRPLLTINGIEQAAKIPSGNLSKFLRRKRNLPDVQLQRLGNLLTCIGYGLSNETLGMTPASETSVLPLWGNTLPIFNPEEADVERTAEADQSGDEWRTNECPLPQDEGKQAPEDSLETAIAMDWLDREEQVSKMSVVEQVAERQALREQYANDDFWAWINMPGIETVKQIDLWLKTFRNRRMLTGLKVQVRFSAGVWDVKSSWRCYVELIEASGKVYRDRHNKDFVYRKEASQEFCAGLKEGNGWTYIHRGESHFYVMEVGNPVIEPKPKKEKPAKLQPAPKPAEEQPVRYLIDMLMD